MLRLPFDMASTRIYGFENSLLGSLQSSAARCRCRQPVMPKVSRDAVNLSYASEEKVSVPSSHDCPIYERISDGLFTRVA